MELVYQNTTVLIRCFQHLSIPKSRASSAEDFYRQPYRQSSAECFAESAPSSLGIDGNERRLEKNAILKQGPTFTLE